jgi:hypothetical protein
MDIIPVDVAGFIEPGAPLHPSEEVFNVPADAIDPDRELVYRFLKDAGEIRAGNYVVAELRDCAHSGELVVARHGENVFVGRWWGKHGLAEVRDQDGKTVVQNPVVLASINQILSLP